MKYTDGKLTFSLENGRWCYTVRVPYIKPQVCVFVTNRENTIKGNVTVVDIYLGNAHIAKVELIRSSFPVILKEDDDQTKATVLLFFQNILEKIDIGQLRKTINTWAKSKLRSDITVLMVHTYTGIGTADGFCKMDTGKITAMRLVPNKAVHFPGE